MNYTTPGAETGGLSPRESSRDPNAHFPGCLSIRESFLTT
jgi:hypothetical protein